MAQADRSAGDRTDGTRSRPVEPGRLPISELAFDRPAAPSPFGDDVVFPLPVEQLQYTHTVTR